MCIYCIYLDQCVYVPGALGGAYTHYWGIASRHHAVKSVFKLIIFDLTMVGQVLFS